MAGGIPRTGHFEEPSGATLVGSPSVLVTATSSPGTTWHTAGAGTDNVDQVWCWAACRDPANSRTLYLEVGGVLWGAFTVPRLAKPTELLIGVPIANARAVQFYASVASDVMVWGRVFRIEKGAVA